MAQSRTLPAQRWLRRRWLGPRRWRRLPGLPFRPTPRLRSSRLRSEPRRLIGRSPARRLAKDPASCPPSRPSSFPPACRARSRPKATMCIPSCRSTTGDYFAAGSRLPMDSGCSTTWVGSKATTPEAAMVSYSAHKRRLCGGPTCSYTRIWWRRAGVWGSPWSSQCRRVAGASRRPTMLCGCQTSRSCGGPKSPPWCPAPSPAGCQRRFLPPAPASRAWPEPQRSTRRSRARPWAPWGSPASRRPRNLGTSATWDS
mmetsp:Transcript_93159/g.268084  ORF Transcript_93159/g.268084 Transcript_93159/m.268084 type:complete len:256 (-) Transcript_93159:965-1732(-)